MTPEDKKRFAAVLAGIADYYGKKLSGGVIELYWQGLQQYDLPAIERAFWEHARCPDSGQFMPKIADVVRILLGRTEDQAARAWAKVDSAVRRVGTHSDVVFDDPTIHRVVHDMGGWILLGQKSETEWPFVGKEFQNRYRGYRIRNEVPEYPSVLIGIANSYNLKEGYLTQPPMLVGDQAQARRVMLAGARGPLLAIQRAGDVLPEVRQISAA